MLLVVLSRCAIFLIGGRFIFSTKFLNWDLSQLREDVRLADDVPDGAIGWAEYFYHRVGPDAGASYNYAIWNLVRN